MADDECEIDFVSYPDFDFVLDCDVADAPGPLDECQPTALIPPAAELVGPPPEPFRMQRALVSTTIGRNSVGTVCVWYMGAPGVSSDCVEVYNHFGPIYAGQYVFIAEFDDTWVIIGVVVPACRDITDVTSWSGWDGTKEQVFVHTIASGDTVCFSWIDDGECETP